MHDIFPAPPSLNITENKLADIFFDARAAALMLRSCKTMAAKRECYAIVTPALETFLNLSYTDDARDQIDYILKSRSRNTLQGLLKEMFKSSSPLLPLETVRDLHSLKTAYRAAALKHHPDRGGKHENMVALNSQYATIQEVISSGFDVAFTASETFFGFRNIPTLYSFTLFGFRVEAAELLMSIRLDNWQSDYLEDDLQRTGWQDVCKIKVQESPLLYSLELMLRQAVYDAEHFKIKCANLKALVHIVGACRSKLELSGKREDMRGRMKPLRCTDRRRIPATIEQLESLLRMGVITQIAANKYFERFKLKGIGQQHRDKEVQNYARQHGFLSLPNDPPPPLTCKVTTMIPEPGYFIAPDGLSLAQLNEYYTAFSEEGNAKLIQKYLYPRLVSIFRSVILFPKTVLIQNCERECKFLSSYHLLKRWRYADRLAGVLSFFRSEEEMVLKERIAILGKLHEIAMSKTYSGLGPRFVIGMDMEIPRLPIETLRQQLNALENYRNTEKFLRNA